MKLFRRIIIWLLVLVVVLYVAAMGVLYFFQRSFQYEPGTKVLALADVQLPLAEAVTIPTNDGESIHGWFQAPVDGHPLIFYAKGNADNFTGEHERYEAFTADGYGFLAFDYRGFPASPGVLNQAHVLADALAAFDWAKAKGFPIVIWGRSLGSGPATYVASERAADALLLETPFDSALAVGKDRYGMFPLDWLMLDQYPVDQWILKVQEPVFVAHGTVDKTIATYHGQRVYDLAPNKSSIWIQESAGHSDLWKAGIWDRAKTFFEAAEKTAGH